MKNTAQTFLALAEETRLRILALLIRAEELCVCDFVEVLQLPQSTVSRHLAHLKNVGWLRDRREGVWIYYALNRPLPSLHQALLPTLEQFLREQRQAEDDASRLQATRQRGSCA